MNLGRESATATALRISRVSAPELSNKATALTSLLLIPLSGVLLMLFVARSFDVPDLTRTAYAATVVTYGITIIGGVTAQTARDRQGGVLIEVLSRNFFYTPYWLSKVAISAGLGVVVAISVGGAILMVDGGDSLTMFLRMLLILPLVTLLASVASVGIAAMGLLWSDQYFLGNIFQGLLPITAGVIVPLTSYPSWLAWISTFLPFTGSVELLSESAWTFEANLPIVVRELVIVAIILLTGWALSKYVVRRIRAGKFREEMQ